MTRVVAAVGRAVVAAILVLPAGTALAAGGGIEIMPSLPKLIPLIALFALMIVPVNRLLIQPMLAVLDERDEKIAGARGRAAEVGKRADAVLASYESSVASAREEAEGERRGQLDQARSTQAERLGRERGDAESRLDQARSEIQTALDQARGGLRAEAEQLARQAAERMLGRGL